MLFNSLLFLFFFLIVYIIFHFSHQIYRKYILLVSSMIFYASWDYLNFENPIPLFFTHFLIVICINYLFILGIEKSGKQELRKFFMILSTLFNLTNLAFFKYFYFIFEIISSITGNPEWHSNARANFQIILPIAISFYSFQIIAFVVDKYRGEIPDHTTFVEFSLFIFFFPQQLAGPILKANEFFPRLHSPKDVTKDDIEIGLYYILLGVIKKGVFADSLAHTINPIFANPSEYNAASLSLAIFSFLFQLWGDFAGYCDIAIGCGKLLGFDLPNNFNRPFYSIRFSEMWVRWHITLSRFLRDYIYFPLGGSKYGELRTTFNSAITMVIAGVWHGANWNYILWGIVIAMSLIIERQILDRFRWWKENSMGWDKFIKNCIILSFWFVLSTIFRVNQLADIPVFLERIFSFTGGKKVNYDELVFIPILMMIMQNYEYTPKIIEYVRKKFWIIALSSSLVLLFLLAELGNKQVQFIYFQF
jgi:alginate O-acetyltransferase complex protein AlgI